MDPSSIVNRSDLIVITGANGFVGKRVVDLLLEYGFTKLRCLVRTGGGLAAAQERAVSCGARLEVFSGNLLSLDDCRQLANGASVIIHLAAGRGKSFAGCFMDSALATRNLLEAARTEVGLKRFLSISSISVYSGADMRPGELVDEASPVETEHMEKFDAYSYGKIKQDELVIAYGKEYGIPYAILRPGLVYGPGKKTIPGRLGIEVFSIFIHVGGRNRLPLIYIDNCAEAVVRAAIADGINGEVLLAIDDELPRSRDFLRLFKENVRHFPSITIPYSVFYLLSLIWEKYSEWSKGQVPPIFNRRSCAAYYQSQRYTNRKLKERTGWMPRVGFIEASRRYFEFMKREEIS